MGEEVKSGAYIAIELVICAVVLGIVAYFASVGYSMSQEHEYRKSTAKELRTFDELNSYNNNYVDGDSLVLFTRKYTQNYGICVVGDLVLERGAGIKIYESILRLDMDDPLTNWSEDTVRNKLKRGDKNYVFSTFYVFFSGYSSLETFDMDYSYPSCEVGDVVFRLVEDTLYQDSPIQIIR